MFQVLLQVPLCSTQCSINFITTHLLAGISKSMQLHRKHSPALSCSLFAKHPQSGCKSPTTNLVPEKLVESPLWLKCVLFNRKTSISAKVFAIIIYACYLLARGYEAIDSTITAT